MTTFRDKSGLADRKSTACKQTNADKNLLQIQTTRQRNASVCLQTTRQAYCDAQRGGSLSCTHLNQTLLEPVDAYPRPRLLHKDVRRRGHPPLRPEVDVLEVNGLRASRSRKRSVKFSRQIEQVRSHQIPT